MPGAVLKERGLIDINKAYMQIHFPKNKIGVKAGEGQNNF